jgi:para-aminobenzoate synthetase
MTGAPKKRSVEILQTLEDDERSIYSGVVGYWDVGGGGDWAVTIRSCFKLDSELGADQSSHPGNHEPRAVGVVPDAPEVKVPAPQEEWLVGAGGAITALSDPEAEWDEMVLKLQGVLRAFGPVEFQN